MENTGTLAGLTLFITGASRGIGKAIALKAAKDGANIVIAAKTSQPHPKLPGTIYTAAEEIEKAGGRALPCIVDVRSESDVKKAVEDAVKTFGGIDIVVNNASAISLTNTQNTPLKKFDLMQQINTRGTFLVSKYCIPHLLTSKHPHILNNAPPLNLAPVWFKDNAAYTMAKYGMSMCTLGMAEELKEYGIACNSIWPKNLVYTAASRINGDDDRRKLYRKPEIMADAAYAILCRDPRTFTGNFVIDENILKEEGITNLDIYSFSPGSPLLLDFFIEGGEDLMALAAFQHNSQAAETAPDSLSPVAQVFKNLNPLLNRDLVNETNAVFLFDLMSGGKASKWYLDLKHDSGACGTAESFSHKVDVTFKLSEEDFLRLFQGELKAMPAFMSGKLKITGDLGKAAKLENLIKMKSKL